MAVYGTRQVKMKRREPYIKGASRSFTGFLLKRVYISTLKIRAITSKNPVAQSTKRAD
jgi:hypothetical protein